LVIAGLGLAFFSELLCHPTQILYSDYSDFIPLHLPSKRFLIHSFRETGELPLWCPYNFSGMPFIHDIQVSAFYPPHWLLFLLPEEHIGAGLSWLIVFHVIGAGWCMYLLARNYGLHGAGALLAALGYMFAGKWLLHILAGGHYNMVPLAWLPLVLLCFDRAIRCRSVIYATWAGAVFSLFVLGAYPYLTLYAGMFVALWTLGPALETAGSSGQWTVGSEQPKAGDQSMVLSTVHCPLPTLKALAWWLGLGAWTALVAVGLGAIQLLPGLEASANASRSLGIPASANFLASGVHSLVGLIGPEPTPGPETIWENRTALGVLWFCLAALAWVVGGKRVRFQVVVFVLLIAYVLVGALLLQPLPGFRFFQLPSRMLLVASIPISLLAGTTTQALLAGPNAETVSDCRRLLLKITVGAFILMMVFALATAAQGKVIRAHFYLYWITAVLTVSVAWLFLAQRWASKTRPTLQAILWSGILLLDSWAIAGPHVAVRWEGEIFAPSQCVDFLAKHRPEHGRVLDFNPQDQSANCTPLWPGLSMVEEIEPIRGFNPIDVLRYKEYLQFVTDSDEPLRPLDRMFTSPLLGTFPIRNQSLADLLGIRYLLQPADLPLEDTVPDPSARKAWQKVKEDPHPKAFNFVSSTPTAEDCGLKFLPPYVIFENCQVMPRAFVVSRAEALPQRGILEKLKATNFRSMVLLEDFEARQLPEGQEDISSARPQPLSPEGRGGKARIVQYLPNRVEVEVTADTPGFLVLTDIWFPGWKGFVDGQASKLYRANYLFRAVAVPAGTSRVEFRFVPESFRQGRLISLVFSGLLLSLGLWAWLKFKMRCIA
jgi:hypothetical protein